MEPCGFDEALNNSAGLLVVQMPSSGLATFDGGAA